MTAQVNKQDISQAILAQVNSLPREEAPSEFSLKRIQKEIDKLRGVDVSMAYQLYGALASIRGDVGEVHRNHNAAVSMSPGDSQALSNYACSLFRMGFLSASVEKMEKALAADPGNPEVIGRLVRQAFVSGRFRRAFELVSTCSDLLPKDQHIRVDDVARAAEIQAAKSLRDEDTSRMVDLAMESLHKCELYSIELLMETRADDESAWASLTIFPPLAKDRVPLLNDVLADKLVDADVAVSASSAITIRFTAANPDGHNSR